MSIISRLKSLFSRKRSHRTVCISRLPPAYLAVEISAENHLRRAEERQKKLDAEYQKMMKYITKRITDTTWNSVIVSVPNNIVERVSNAVRLQGYTFEHIETRSRQPMYKISWKHKL